VDYLARDVTGKWRGKKGDKHCEIFRLPDIASRTILRDPFALRFLGRQ
jgi:hypothetical protein